MSSIQEVLDMALAYIKDDAVVQAGYTKWETVDLDLISALSDVDSIKFYTAIIQYALDSVDRTDSKRARFICESVTDAIVSVKDYWSEVFIDPSVLKQHAHAIIKFCTKFPAQTDGMWRSTLFPLTEMFSPLNAHEPWSKAKIFATPEDDIFTISQPYLITADAAKADKKAAQDRIEQLAGFSLFYRECSQSYIADGSAATIYQTFLETQKMMLAHLDVFFPGNGRANKDVDHFLFPQSLDEDEDEPKSKPSSPKSTKPAEYFFAHENDFSNLFSTNLSYIVSYSSYNKTLTAEQKAEIVEAIEGPLKPLEKTFLKHAISLSYYLKYLSSPLISRQLGYMVDYITKYKDVPGYKDLIAEIKAQGHPLAEKL